MDGHMKCINAIWDSNYDEIMLFPHPAIFIKINKIFESFPHSFIPKFQKKNMKLPTFAVK